jgi:hypothetical protein
VGHLCLTEETRALSVLVIPFAVLNAIAITPSIVSPCHYYHSHHCCECRAALILVVVGVMCSVVFDVIIF